jgi:hypothetical protein
MRASSNLGDDVACAELRQSLADHGQPLPADVSAQ